VIRRVVLSDMHSGVASAATNTDPIARLEQLRAKQERIQRLQASALKRSGVISGDTTTVNANAGEMAALDPLPVPPRPPLGREVTIALEDAPNVALAGVAATVVTTGKIMDDSGAGGSGAVAVVTTTQHTKGESGRGIDPSDDPLHHSQLGAKKPSAGPGRNHFSHERRRLVEEPQALSLAALRADGSHLETVDEGGCTATLLTTVFLLRAAPLDSGGIKSFVTILASLVFACQAGYALKLVRNAAETDHHDLAGFIREGYMTLDFAQLGNITDCAALILKWPTSSTFVEQLQEQEGLNNTAIDEGRCHLAMSREFLNRFEEIQAFGLSEDLQDLPVCLTASGLENGSINMVAGMLIVAVTVILGLVEQLSGTYALQSVKLVFVCVASILFHVGLAGMLLIASRQRIATVANDFWSVVEAAVTVFLVVELDDLVLFCVRRHPAVHHELMQLHVGKISANHNAANRPPTETFSNNLFLCELLRIPSKSLPARLGRDSLGQPKASALLLPDHQQHEAPSTEECLCWCGWLLQPIVWIRSAVPLAPYKFFVEWMCWWATFSLIGSSILDLVQLTCPQGRDARGWIHELAVYTTFCGNTVALGVFTTMDLKRVLAPDLDLLLDLDKLRNSVTSAMSQSPRSIASKVTNSVANIFRDGRTGSTGATIDNATPSPNDGSARASGLRAPTNPKIEVKVDKTSAITRQPSENSSNSPSAAQRQWRKVTGVTRMGLALGKAAANNLAQTTLKVGKVAAQTTMSVGKAAVNSARKVNRGDLARAIVYYASVWTFVIAYGSLLLAEADTETEMKILFPMGFALAVVKFWLVPTVDWARWCRDKSSAVQASAEPLAAALATNV
jgi:hypothetical protein